MMSDFDFTRGRLRKILVQAIALAGTIPAISFISATAEAAPSVPVTLEAESMQTKSTGTLVGDYWGLYSNGYVENEVYFASSGSYDVKVLAYASLAKGVGAATEVRVDGSRQAGSTISSTSATTVSYRINISSAGNHRIAVAFTNDYWSGKSGGEDRNLFIDKVSVNAVIPTAPVTLEAESMQTKTGGVVQGAYYGLYSAGYVENQVYFPVSGTYDVKVLGYAQLAQGVGAATEVRIDGTRQAGSTISATSATTTVYKVNVSAGAHRLAIAFTNDYYAGGEDRNLFLDKVSVALSTTTASPTPTPTPVPATPTPTPTPPPLDPSQPGGNPYSRVPSGYQLKFTEDFNGTSLNTSIWNTNYRPGEEHLDELSRYVPTALKVSNGMLMITAKPRYDGTGLWDSGMIRSNANYRYGYYEGRFKFSANKGSWPAFWLYAADGWPPEIDIFEIPMTDGVGPTGTTCNVHGPGFTGDQPGSLLDQWGIYRPGYSFADGNWHTFAVDWRDTTATFYVDGVKIVTRNYRWLHSDGSLGGLGFLTANLAIGGAWPGNPATNDPVYMYIDYIRYYAP